MEVTMSQRIDQRILNHKPSLKHKIAQMLIIGFTGKVVTPNLPIIEYIAKQQIGGVILFDLDVQAGNNRKNIESPQQLKKLTHDLKQHANFPLLIGIDYEGGGVNRLKESYGFPKTLSQVEIAKLSALDAQTHYLAMAQTLKDNGVNLNFAPVVDLNLNDQSPIIGKLGRSYSSDPQQVCDYAKIALSAYWQAGVCTTVKHFPGHGSTCSDPHAGMVDVTDTWQTKELIPYQTLFNFADHALAKLLVMTGHIIDRRQDEQGEPASLSYAITQKLLREKLGYQGVIMTDDLQMPAVTKTYPIEQAVILAINAGADLLLFGNQLVSQNQNPYEIIEIVAKSIQQGKINPDRIHESYQRIMTLKQSS